MDMFALPLREETATDDDSENRMTEDIIPALLARIPQTLVVLAFPSAVFRTRLWIFYEILVSRRSPNDNDREYIMSDDSENAFWKYLTDTYREDLYNTCVEIGGQHCAKENIDVVTCPACSSPSINMFCDTCRHQQHDFLRDITVGLSSLQAKASEPSDEESLRHACVSLIRDRNTTPTAENPLSEMDELVSAQLVHFFTACALRRLKTMPRSATHFCNYDRFRYHLADWLMRVGRLEESEDLLRECLAEFETKFGVEGTRTVIVKGQLANNLLSQNRFAEAEALYRACLRDKHNQMNVQVDDVQVTVDNLVLLLKRDGRFEEAEEFIEGMHNRVDLDAASLDTMW